MASEAVSQRRRLAVLALIAASGDGGITRDRVVGLLWPESDEERARHALAQLLYGLRRALGDEAIGSGPIAIRIDPSVLSSDVQDLEAAVARGDHAEAARLYQGPFLDGFYINGCPDFERWVEDRRAGLGRIAEDAIETLAKRAAAAGDFAQALDCWRRLATLRPLDGRVALAYMHACVDVGDRAGAIQHARVHEALLRAELDAAPMPAVASYAAALRAMPAGEVAKEIVAPPTPIPASQSTAPADAERSVAAVPTISASAPSIASTPSSASSASAPPVKRQRKRWLLAGVAAAGLLIAAGAERTLHHSADAGRPWLIITDVENATGDSVFDRTIPVALAAALAQSPRVRVVPPDRIQRALVRMRRIGADSLLTAALAREIAERDGVPAVAVPTIDRAGDAYELATRVLDARTGAVLGFSAVRATDRASVLDALDRLGRALRGVLGESNRSIAANAVPLPLVTTPSLEALKLYADASRMWRIGRHDQARLLYTQAVAVDSTFASAYASLGMIAFWDNMPTTGDSNYAKALAHIGALPEREQLMIRASAKSWRGDRAGSAALLRPYVAAHEDDIGAAIALAYDYLRMGAYADAADAYTKVLAIDSSDFGSWINLATVESERGHAAAALRAYGRAYSLSPSTITANNNVNLEYASAFVLAGQRDSAARVVALLTDSPEPLRHARGLRSKAFLAAFDGRYGDAARALDEAVTIDRSQGPLAAVSEVRNRLLLAAAFDRLARASDAQVQIDSAYALVTRIDAEPRFIYWVGKSVARGGDVARATRLLAALEPKVHAGSPVDLAALEALRGEILIASGKASDAIPHLERACAAECLGPALESLAYGSATAGALDRAAELYERLGKGMQFGSEDQDPWRLSAYWLGRVRERTGKAAAARTAYEQFLAQWGTGAKPDLREVEDARARLARLSQGERGG